MRRSIYLLLAAFAIVVSCKPAEPEQKAPAIASISPESGYVGDVVTIKGTDFGATADANTVKFGTAKAEITSASATELKVTAPKNNPGAVKVTVATAAGTSSGVSFTYVQPEVSITSISPETGFAGDEVTIKGKNFNPTPDNNTVMFGTSMSEVRSASETELKVLAPGGIVGVVDVTVAVGTNKSNAVKFSYKSDKSLITEISPASAKIGETVTISGSFLEPYSENKVFFGTAEAKVNKSEAYLIEAVVPEGYGAVEVKVKSSKDESNAVNFNYVAGDPSVSGLSVAAAEVGDIITVKGQNFSPNKSDVTVSFGSASAEVVESRMSEIDVIVPQYEEGKLDVKVGVTVGGKATNEIDFHYLTYYWAEIIAGSGEKGSDDGQTVDALSAKMNQPIAVIPDNKGNIYIGEATGGVIRKLTPSGKLEFIAGKYATTGSADGKGADATFKYIYSLALDSKDNIYVADVTNHLIRKVTQDGTVTTIAGTAGSKQADSKDGIGADAWLCLPYTVAMYDDTHLLIGDGFNLRMMDLATGEVKSIVGSPNSIDFAAIDNFYNIRGIAVSPDKKTIYVSDGLNNCVKAISYPECAVRRIAGPEVRTNILGKSFEPLAECKAEDALFYNPSNIVLDSKGNLYLADGTGDYNHRIRRITPDGRVYTIANATGATTPAVTGPCRALEMTYKGWGLGIDKDDNLYVCDQKNNLVFRLTLK